MDIKTKAFGTVEITLKIKDDERQWWLQAAIEKGDPKKTTLEMFWDRDSDLDDKPEYDTWVCPRCNCHHEIDNRYAYCPYCGQRIDWKGIKDEEAEEHDTKEM